MKKSKTLASVVIAIFLVQILTVGFLSVPAQAAGDGYWQMKSKEIHYVEPFLPEKLTYPSDLPWNQTFTKVVNGGEMSTSYTGQEYDVTRHYSSKYWPQPVQSLRFTWSEMPQIINPGETYKVWLETSGNGSGSGNISKLTNIAQNPMWLATAVNNRRADLDLITDAPSDKKNPEKRMILVQMSSGAAGTDTFNYASYCYIYEWVTVQPKIASITVKPNKITISNSSATQLSVKAKLTDGTEIDITKDGNTEYDVDDESVLSVSSTGLVKPNETAENGDSATITVSNGEAEASCEVIFATTKVKMIKSSSPKVVVYNQAGKNTKQLKITAVMTNGKQVNVTKEAVYTVSNPEFLSVNAQGLLTVLPGGKKGSSASVTVEYGGKSVKIKVTIK